MFVRLIFVAAIVLSAIIGAAFLVPELQATHGIAHSVYETIRQGGDGHGVTTIRLGWLFGVATFVLIFSLLSLGVSRKSSLRGLGWFFLIIFLLTVAAWTAVILAYEDYVQDPYQDLVLGFPLPTALMIFAMIPAMVLINILFVVMFPKSILTQEDIDRHRNLAGDPGDDS